MNITSDAWQADTEALRARAQQAEARIQAVRATLDRHAHYDLVEADDVRHALNGDA